MFASIKSATILGVHGIVIRVEVHTSSGFPGYTVVGMPDTAMRESKERIRAAMISSDAGWPATRMTINLAPANVRKSGTGSELAILIGLLCTATPEDKRLKVQRFENAGVIGELGLDGTIRPVSGTIARVLALRNSGVEEVFVPVANAYEASLVGDIKVFPIKSVQGLIACLTQGEPWPDIVPSQHTLNEVQSSGDYSEISGQPLGCEAMMLLAAGGHHTLLMGSPGIGKTMLAERLPSILPPLTDDESHEITAIASILEGRVDKLLTRRPFRHTHHSASAPAMVGGGSTFAVPGEVTRAHKGVLFLDELSEFTNTALDVLRQPLETGTVTISRAQFSTSLPAEFTLLGCSNPCPCAKPREKCICSDVIRQRYLRKLSGPLLDRFDIRLELFRSPYVEGPTHTSTEMSARITQAIERQHARNADVGVVYNARLNSMQLAQVVPLSRSVEMFFRERVEKREISGRGATAIWRVARTLADLDDTADITELHMSRACDFREEIA
ncbi:MAG TPA: YifB family Mg chelatase-like AAA ATPase [Acidimicrobiia bacterium]|nr:YifB family Mg chelatase-like AAA ATPase [Acidimicrobiia bacterium]